MPGYSKMLNIVPNLARSSLLFTQKSNILNKSIVSNNQLLTQLRGSHARTMFIRPGKFYTKKYFDILHFHFVLAGLPFFLFVAYQNFFVGPATLTEIPEGYEPRYWEYHRNPVKRFLARYVYEIPDRAYERNLHFVYVENAKQKMRNLENKVRTMMKEKQDYKAWYYVPVPKETFEMKQEFQEKHARLGYDPKYTK